MYQLAEAADMTYSTFKEHYLQSDDPRSSPAIRQENIIKIAKLLGINVRMTLVLSPIDNVDTSEIKKIPYRNDRKRRNSKKKDTDRGSVQGGDDSK